MTEPEREVNARPAIGVGSAIGQYRIVARLCSGGMATLFLARRKGPAGFSRHVAIKVIHPHLGEDPRFVRMFLDEALLASQVQHPNVVTVEELGDESGTYFLVMEYVHGCSLAELMKGLRRIKRWVTAELAVWITTQVARGLQAAHEAVDESGRSLGIVHRDVSPQNILISTTGNIKLIDFGVAKAALRAHHTRTGALKGKLRYMAPEQLGSGAIDRRTDVYALGIVLWELLARRRLFVGDELTLLEQVRYPEIPRPSNFVPSVPEAVEAAVLRALETDPDRRPATMLDFRKMLEDAMPEASRLDGNDLADVVLAVLGDELEERRRGLPDSVSGVSFGAPEPREADRPPGDRQAVLASFTLHAPDEFEEVRDGPTRSERPRRRPMPRWLPFAIGAGAVGLLTLGVGVFLLALSAYQEEQPSTVASPPYTTVPVPVPEPVPEPVPVSPAASMEEPATPAAAAKSPSRRRPAPAREPGDAPRRVSIHDDFDDF